MYSKHKYHWETGKLKAVEEAVGRKFEWNHDLNVALHTLSYSISVAAHLFIAEWNECREETTSQPLKCTINHRARIETSPPHLVGLREHVLIP